MCDNNCSSLCKLLLLFLFMQHVARTDAAIKYDRNHNNNNGDNVDDNASETISTSDGIVDGIESDEESDDLLYAEHRNVQKHQKKVVETVDAAATDMDLNSYANDLNKKDETTSPEDIYDHITDARNDDKIKDYDAAASAIDAIDFQDDDAESADIVLEPHGPTSKNFTMFFLNNKNNKQGADNDNKRQRLKTNKQMKMQKKLATDTQDADTNHDNIKPQQTKQKHKMARSNEDKSDEEMASQELENYDTKQQYKTSKTHNKQQHNNAPIGDIQSDEKTFTTNRNADNEDDDEDDNEDAGDADDDDTITAKTTTGKTNKLIARKLKRHSRNDEISTYEQQRTASSSANDFKSAYYGQQLQQKEAADDATDSDQRMRANEDTDTDAGPEIEAAAVSSSEHTNKAATLQQHAHGRTLKLPNKLKTYFGILTNGSKHSDNSETASNDDDDDDLTVTQIMEDGSSSRSADVDDAAIQVYAISRKVKSKNKYQQQPNQQHSQAAQPREHQPEQQFLSAFEQQKTMRRVNKRIGHKVHKKRYKNYLRYLIDTTPIAAKANNNATGTLQGPKNDNSKESLQQPKQISKKLTINLGDRMEDKEQTMEATKPASPIFTVKTRSTSAANSGKENKPYFEGQINYFVDNKDSKAAFLPTEHENDDNWYRNYSPMLRNGIKQRQGANDEQPHHHRQHHHSYQQHQHRQHHHKQHLSNSARQNPYQRKMLKSNNKPARPPIPPPSYKQQLETADAVHELGHQITELEDLERYYAKWPHLARVQFQVYDEHFREEHPDIYPEYPEYESVAELEAAENENSEESKLPPYIKKYNRRNKQLLDLLEGTVAPVPRPLKVIVGDGWRSSGSVLQPGPHESNAAAQTVRNADEYMKEKRQRSQLRNMDLFATQHNNANTAEKSSNGTSDSQQNQIPDEDLNISQEQQRQQINTASVFNWQREIENKSNANFELTGSTQMTRQMQNDARNSVAEQRTHSANNLSESWHAAGNAKIVNDSKSATAINAVNEIRRQSSGIVAANLGTARTMNAQRSNKQPQQPSVNSFVYHRVVDAAASPRFVGAGNTIGGRKQLLPFVAITDRRLDSSGNKKSLIERQKDFEQNFYPMP